MPLPALDADPHAATEALHAAYRLPLDRRLVRAFSLAAEIATGAEAPATVADWEDGAWQVRTGDEVVATLPEFAGFEQAVSALSARVKTFAMSLKAGSAAKTAFVGDWAEEPFAALNGFDADWAAGNRDLAHVRAAARGLGLASLQMRDTLDAGDELPARALALLAILRAHGDPALFETALLAEAMGYHADSRIAAAKLAPRDPLRAFVLREDTLLASLAKASPTSPAGYLFLLRMAQTREAGRFEQTRATCCKTASGISIAAPMTVIGSRTSAQAYSGLVTLALSGAGQDAGESSADAAARMASSAAGGSLAKDFTELVGKPSQKPGRLVGPEPRRAYLRAAFHTGGAGFFLHHLDARAVPEQAKKFAESLGAGVPGSPEAVLAPAFAVLLDEKLAEADLHDTVLRYETKGSLGARLVEGLRRKSSNFVLFRSGIRAHARRLDSRSSNRAELYTLTWTSLDLPIAERLAASLVTDAPRRYGEVELWLAGYRRDTAALGRIGTDAANYPGTRMRAFLALANLEPAQAGNARTQIEAILAANPDGADLIDEFVDDLLAAGDYKRARKTLDQALRSYVSGYVVKNGEKIPLGDTGTTADQIRTRLAGLALAERRCDDGWRIVEPRLSGQHGGMLKFGAYLQACMGNREKALELVEAVATRYPGPSATFARVRTLWNLDDYDAAGALLEERYLEIKSESNALGKRFYEDHRRLDPKERMESFRKLAKSPSFPFVLLEQFADAEAKAGSPEVAFSHLTIRQMKGADGLNQSIKALRFLEADKAMKSEDTIAWMRTAIASVGPEVTHFSAEAILFSQGEERMIPLLLGEAPSPPAEESRWAFRAAAAAEAGPPYPVAVSEHYETPDPAEELVTGRFLLDLGATSSDLFARDRKRAPDEIHNWLSSSAFNLGLKAELAGRIDEATVWYTLSHEYRPADRNSVTYTRAHAQLEKWRGVPGSRPRVIAPPAKKAGRRTK